ncbi:FmdE family protein [Desulfothermobacter acidiphilus]|uniref:FmdE family protein n=1 Tax=Desulfothermobacter acidiphilus TaxID=1938353 RepID=UPI003F891F72
MRLRLVAMLAGLALLLVGGVYAAAQQFFPVKVLVNGPEVAFDTSPVISGGRTLVPLRALVEVLGGAVNWHPDRHVAEVVFPAPPPGAEPSYFFWRGVGEQAAKKALSHLGASRDLLVLTNAGYVNPGGKSTLPCLDGLMALTACTEGKGNLLRVHTADTRPLWFFFWDKKSGQGVFLELDRSVALQLLNRPADQPLGQAALWSKVACENIAAEHLLSHPQQWNQKVQAKIFDGFEFGIVTIANLVAHGAPPELIQSALFHDHLCPGVTSGYLIAEYLKRNFPLSPGESYYVLALPPWCKEDALQVVLNTTPGKGGMAVIPMNEAAKARLKPEAKNLAGIYFRYHPAQQRGEGLVLAFDFGKAYEQSGVDMAKSFPWESRLKLDLWLLQYLDRPELFVTEIKRFQLAPGEVPSDYAQPGTNPLVKLGLWQQ